MRLELDKVYLVVDVLNNRRFYVRITEELHNWEYDYNTYSCIILDHGAFYKQILILVTELWEVYEASSLEIEML